MALTPLAKTVRDETVSATGKERVGKALQLRLALSADGITFYLEPDGKVGCNKFNKLDPDVRAQLVDLKPELLQILSAEARRASDPCDSETMPFEELCRMIRDGSTPGEVAFAMTVRYRDPKGETLEFWQRAVRSIGRDELIGFLKEAEGAKIKEKPKYLSKILKEASRGRQTG